MKPKAKIACIAVSNKQIKLNKKINKHLKIPSGLIGHFTFILRGICNIWDHFLFLLADQALIVARDLYFCCIF